MKKWQKRSKKEVEGAISSCFVAKKLFAATKVMLVAMKQEDQICTSYGIKYAQAMSLSQRRLN